MGGMVYTSIDSTKLSTAECYGLALCELAKEHPEIVALTPDLAKSTKTSVFAKQFPERLFNVGIAEQNMFGIASGLAKCGFVPYASCFAIFAAARALDQIHTDIAYQNVPVKIIGTHSGTSFGQAGSTHHCLIDLSVMRTLPHFTVICPCDGAEAFFAVKASYDIPGPVYIRINRGFDAIVNKTLDDVNFEWDKAAVLKEGKDLTIIAVGSCVFEALQAARMLKSDLGLEARVLNMHTVKPIDKEAILKAIDETGTIVTVEDNEIQGGLGSAVAEVVASAGKACQFKMLGHDNNFSTIGLQEDLLDIAGIDANGIEKAVAELIGQKLPVKEDWDEVY